MSSKKKYQVVSAGNFKIKQFDTITVPTNTFLKTEDNELAFFKLEESLYRIHGIICVENIIEYGEESRLAINLSKISEPVSQNIKNNIYFQTFGTPDEFNIKENMILGTLTMLTL